MYNIIKMLSNQLMQVKGQCEPVKTNKQQTNTGTHSTGSVTVGGDPSEQTSLSALDQRRATVQHYLCIEGASVVNYGSVLGWLTPLSVLL